ncbi:MAG: hypothetical protein FWF34_02695, partial [Alphaproteobacteria bacterium]|nr:hypothetical protein [Alphaproteobacteria bacterium]
NWLWAINDRILPSTEKDKGAIQESNAALSTRDFIAFLMQSATFVVAVFAFAHAVIIAIPLFPFVRYKLIYRSFVIGH